MKELVVKVARAIAPCGNNVMDKCPTPCPHCTEDAGLAIKAVLSHFSEPGNISDGMVLGSIIPPNDPKGDQLRLAFKNPKHKETIERTRSSIARSFHAALEEFKQ